MDAIGLYRQISFSLALLDHGEFCMRLVDFAAHLPAILLFCYYSSTCLRHPLQQAMKNIGFALLSLVVKICAPTWGGVESCWLLLSSAWRMKEF